MNSRTGASSSNVSRRVVGLSRNPPFVLLLVLLSISFLFAGCGSTVLTEPTVAPRPPQIRSHTVQQGETLYSLARQYGSSVAMIVDLNGLTDASQIAPGMTLRIPSQQEEGGKRLPSISKGRMVPLGFAKAFVGEFAWPCESRELSSRFGKRGNSFHEGIDIRARPGTPVYAAHDGKVVFSGRGLSGYGRLVAIRGEGVMTLYAHNSRNLVDKYEYVKRGDQIAESGESGSTTGPHLHFEVRLINSQGRYHAVDPLVFYPRG